MPYDVKRKKSIQDGDAITHISISFNAAGLSQVTAALRDELEIDGFLADYSGFNGQNNVIGVQHKLPNGRKDRERPVLKSEVKESIARIRKENPGVKINVGKIVSVYNFDKI